MCFKQFVDSRTLDCLKEKKRLDYDSKVEVTKGNAMLNKENSTTVSIYVSYLNDKKIVQEEMLVYDTPGMISQIGGIISLFIGISFFSLIAYMLDFLKKYFNKIIENKTEKLSA